MPASGPDLERSRRQYTAVAEGYDRLMRRTRRWQQLAVDRLFLGDGETVLDVACGTGLNFQDLRTAVGRRGRIIGIDSSPEMIERARERVSRSGWTNVDLIEAAVEEADIDGEADAALFSFTHDVLQSPAAVDNILPRLKQGGRVSSVGAKWAPGWAVPVNIGVRLAARRFVTTFDGMDRPWRLLEPYTGNLRLERLALGGAYVAWGEIRGT